MKKILTDTNFLLMPFEYGVDLASELQRITHGPATVVISSGTMDELGALSGRSGKKAAAARFVLQNLEKLKEKITIEVVPSAGPVDEWIIKFACKNNVCVATNDVSLRKRLLALGVPIIAMKGKSKLDFV